MAKLSPMPCPFCEMSIEVTIKSYNVPQTRKIRLTISFGDHECVLANSG